MQPVAHGIAGQSRLCVQMPGKQCFSHYKNLAYVLGLKDLNVERASFDEITG